MLDNIDFTAINETLPVANVFDNWDHGIGIDFIVETDDGHPSTASTFTPEATITIHAIAGETCTPYANYTLAQAAQLHERLGFAIAAASNSLDLYTD
ncbi:hypothetical protein CH282_15325 [Rhodococcus sp. 06-418-1B]|nr:hypothetical protein [Rhodococcus sp. 06-418-1B]OZC84506.1 hypothetical protein CH282_15325 [Rhodococcus sp. 06-418-1B]